MRAEGKLYDATGKQNVSHQKKNPSKVSGAYDAWLFVRWDGKKIQYMKIRKKY